MFQTIQNATLCQYYRAARAEKHKGPIGFAAATALSLAKSRFEYNAPRNIPLTVRKHETILGHGDYIRRNGRTFQILIIDDFDSGPPWENWEGHGPVTDWETRDKLPGELILNSDGNAKRFYNFQEAVAIAKRDGWNAEPYRDNETRGERAAKAARADFEFLRGWCNDQWRYVGVVVVELPKGGNYSDNWETDLESNWHRLPNAALWGIESCADEYISEVALDLIQEV